MRTRIIRPLPFEASKRHILRFNARIEAFDRNPNLKVRLDSDSAGDVLTPSTRSGDSATGAQGAAKPRAAVPAPTSGAASVANVAGFAEPGSVFIRLAIDDAETLDPHSLQLSLDEVPIPVPANGLLELPLEIGDAHRIVATGRRNGRSVQGQLAMTPSLEDEGRPFALVLA